MSVEENAFFAPVVLLSLSQFSCHQRTGCIYLGCIFKKEATLFLLVCVSFDLISNFEEILLIFY